MKQVVNILSEYSSALIELFFPRLCAACANHLFKQEEAICNACFRQFPQTRFETNPYHNPMNQLLWGRVKVETAFALYNYRKGEAVQELLHDLKYRGYTEIGEAFGRKMGQVLNKEIFPTFDLIVPVPLHPNKLRTRGYNQSEQIANGVSEVLKIPVDSTNLYRKLHTSTQTKKGRFERWENVDGIFDLYDSQKYIGCHVLLVDDVTTTGSTLEACIHPFKEVPFSSVSIATVACASL